MKKQSSRAQPSSDTRPGPPRRVKGSPVARGPARQAAPAHTATRPRRDSGDGALFAAAALPAVLIAPSGRLQQTSAGLRELLGYSAAELRRLRFTDLAHPKVGGEKPSHVNRPQRR